MSEQTTLTDQALDDLLTALASEPWSRQVRQVRTIRAALAEVERGAVEVARANGYSWADIAHWAGCSKNNLYRKYRP